MRVLMLKDVEGLGESGDIKDVAGGYAKNYLIPRKLAVAASSGAMKQMQSLKEAAQRRRDRELNEATAVAEKLDGQVLSFQMRAGEGDRLYGSVTSADIVEGLTQATGLEVKRRHIDLPTSIKTLGEHEVTIKLGSGVNATVRVLVDRADAPEVEAET